MSRSAFGYERGRFVYQKGRPVASRASLEGKGGLPVSSARSAVTAISATKIV
jgi:hypothetical protein